MSIPPSTAASSVPWLPIVLIAGLIIAVLAFTMYKKMGKSQTQGQVAELGAAVGFMPVAGASESSPPEALGGLKSLTHGRSHRFAHVMKSEDGGMLFQLGYDTGILQKPSRWSYVVSSSPVDAAGSTTLVLSPSGPDDLASELGFQDMDINGRTIRTEDTAAAEALFASPEAAAWLAAYPEAAVELGGGHLIVMLPGEITDETSGLLEKCLTAHKKLNDAIATP